MGARDAAPHAWRIARSLYPRNDGPWFVEPAGVRRRMVCSKTGLPANPDCPATEEGRAIAGRSSPALCPVHVRDANGELVEREDPALSAFSGGRAGRLTIASPEEGAVFTMVPGPMRQQIVCKVHGNAQDGKLWWFLDGVPAGETVGPRRSCARREPAITRRRARRRTVFPPPSASASSPANEAGPASARRTYAMNVNSPLSGLPACTADRHEKV